MFWHSFKYNVLLTIRDKSQLFWSFIFVLILGTLFQSVFGHIYEMDEVFSDIEVAVYIEDEMVSDIFKSIEKGAMTDDGKHLIKATYVESMEEAEKLLSDSKVKGIYYSGDGELLLEVKETGTDESILSQIVAEYHKEKSIVLDRMENGLTTDSEHRAEYHTLNNEQISFGKGKPNVYMSYFYNLIAMGCLFSAYMGFSFSIKTQANLTYEGARITLADNHRIITGLAGILAIVSTLTAVSMMSVGYLYFIGVEMGRDVHLILVLVFVGTMMGVSIGFMLGKITKLKRNTKEALVTMIVMTMCFLSGLMVGDMRMMVRDFCPLMDKLNPAALLDDSFIAINQFGDMSRFWSNILCMLGWATVMFISGTIMGRRNEYASI